MSPHHWLIVFALLLYSALVQAMDSNEIRSKAIRIQAVDEFVLTVKVDQDVKDQNILTVRLNEDDEFEIIATGKVTSQKSGLTRIKIDGDSMRKRPRTDDYVVFLGPPMEFTAKKPKAEGAPFAMEQEPAEAPEPGYMSFLMMNASESLESASSNQANSYKIYKSIPLSGYSFEWFLDFLSNYGLRISTAKGALPITSYFRQSVDASINAFKFRLMYRLKKRSNFRFTFYLDSGDESFQTSNTDEYIVSTELNVSKLGAVAAFEPGELLLTSPGTKFQWTDLKFDYSVIISGQGKDGLISRGGASQVQGSEMSLSTGVTAYLPWMPWVKRYVLSIELYQGTRNFSFSGDTKSEANGYLIPANGSYEEKFSGYRIWFGFRFEDVVGKTLKPKG